MCVCPFVSVCARASLISLWPVMFEEFRVC